MTPDEKLDKLLNSVARIEQDQQHFCEAVAKHDSALFGRDGRNGLVGDVNEIKTKMRIWNGGLALVLSGAWAAIAAMFAQGGK